MNGSNLTRPRTHRADRARTTSTDDRLGRFYVVWRTPALAMLTRVFGSQLDEHAREDAYAGAWAASLSSLGERIEGMSDGELHNYVFSAVTTHAGKELRRRGRKPVDSMDGVEASGGHDDGPAESALRRENRRVLRDLLNSLPERRRRVITLRYAAGMTPEEICEAVDGLSPRAYRKEINKGIKELAARLTLVESGEWCSNLADQIGTFAKGEASLAVQEQARAHLSHCASCSRAVRELAGSLYDLSLLPAGGLLAGSAANGGGLLEGVSATIDRAKSALSSVISRTGDGESVAGSIASSGGTRGGAGALLAGAGAKLGALGVAGKVAVGCATATAGLATCVATGVVPASAVDGWIPGNQKAERASDTGSGETPAPPLEPAPIPVSTGTIEGDGIEGERTTPDPKPDASATSGPDSANDSQEPEPVIAQESATPVERESSPEVAASSGGGGASGGGSREAPNRADAGDASAQLGLP